MHIFFLRNCFKMLLLDDQWIASIQSSFKCLIAGVCAKKLEWSVSVFYFVLSFFNRNQWLYRRSLVSFFLMTSRLIPSIMYFSSTQNLELLSKSGFGPFCTFFSETLDFQLKSRSFSLRRWSNAFFKSFGYITSVQLSFDYSLHRSSVKYQEYWLFQFTFLFNLFLKTWGSFQLCC